MTPVPKLRVIRVIFASFLTDFPLFWPSSGPMSPKIPDSKGPKKVDKGGPLGFSVLGFLGRGVKSVPNWRIVLYVHYTGVKIF